MVKIDLILISTFFTIYNTPIKKKKINIYIITKLENKIIKILQQSENIDKYQILKIVNSQFIYYIKFNIPLEISNYISLIQVSRYNKIRCYIEYRKYDILNLQYLLCKNTKNQIKKYLIFCYPSYSLYDLQDIIKLKITYSQYTYEQEIQSHEQLRNHTQEQLTQQLRHQLLEQLKQQLRQPRQQYIKQIMNLIDDQHFSHKIYELSQQLRQQPQIPLIQQPEGYNTVELILPKELVSFDILSKCIPFVVLIHKS